MGCAIGLTVAKLWLSKKVKRTGLFRLKYNNKGLHARRSGLWLKRGVDSTIHRATKLPMQLRIVHWL